MRGKLGISQNASLQETERHFLSAESTGNQSDVTSTSAHRVQRGQQMRSQGQGQRIITREDSGVHLLTDPSTESVLDSDTNPSRSKQRSSPRSKLYESRFQVDSNMNHLQQAELQLADPEEMTFDLEQNSFIMTTPRSSDSSYNETSLAEELANQDPDFKCDKSGSYFYGETISKTDPQHDSDCTKIDTQTEMDKNLKHDSIRHESDNYTCMTNPVLKLPFDDEKSDSQVLNSKPFCVDTEKSESYTHPDIGHSSDGGLMSNNLCTGAPSMDLNSGIVSKNPIINVLLMEHELQSTGSMMSDTMCSKDKDSKDIQLDNTSPELQRGGASNELHIQCQTVALDNLSPFVLLRRDSEDSFTSNISMKTEMDSIECVTDV